MGSHGFEVTKTNVAFSGVTANPSIGAASDWIVDQGGSVILTETTEMIGTSHILKQRALSNEIGRQIESIITNTEKETKRVLRERVV